MKIFILITTLSAILFGICAQASPLRCEDLFSDPQMLQQKALSLATFWMDVTLEQDTAKKLLRMKEFEPKFQEFVARVGNSKEAYELLTKAMTRLRESQNQKRIESKIQERARKEKQATEDRKISEWQHFEIFRDFQSSHTDKSYISPDGSTFYSRGPGIIQKLDLKTLQVSTQLMQDRLNDMAFTPDGKKLITVSHETLITLDDLATSISYAIPHTQTTLVQSSLITPDGKRYISVSNRGVINVCDLQTMKQIPVLAPAELTEGISESQLSPDGTKLLARGSVPKTLISFDLNDLATVEQIKIRAKGHLRHFIFIPKTTKAVVAMSTGEVIILDLVTKRQSKTPLKATEKVLNTMALSADGNQVVIIEFNGEIKVLNLKTKILKILPQPQSSLPRDAVFSPDGSRLIVTYDNQVSMFDLETSFEFSLPTNGGAYWKAQFTPDGKKLISSDENGHLMVWFQDKLAVP